MSEIAVPGSSGKIVQPTYDRRGPRFGGAANPSVALKGGGCRLPSAVRVPMERAFGQDFSAVRVHVDSKQAAALGAQSFASGNQIHFAPGKYNPSSAASRELIAHELAHVVQQRSGDVPGRGVVADQRLEKEAWKMAKKAARGQKAR